MSYLPRFVAYDVRSVAYPIRFIAAWRNPGAADRMLGAGVALSELGMNMCDVMSDCTLTQYSEVCLAPVILAAQRTAK